MSHENDNVIRDNMQNKICICLIFGLPGCGKSTLAKSLQNSSTCPSVKEFNNDPRPSSLALDLEDSSNSLSMPSSSCVQKMPSMSNIGPQWTELLSTEILHLEYDNLLPFSSRVNTANSSRASETRKDFEEGLGGANDWKQERTQILKLVDCFIQQFQEDDSSKAAGLTCFELKRPSHITDFVWTHFKHIATSGMDVRDAGIPCNIILLIDDNMYLRSMRYDYYKIARKHACSFCQIFMDCPTNEAVKRNLSRTEDAQVPEEVILKMAGKLESHNDQKHPWEAITYQVNCLHAVKINDILRFLDKALTTPVVPAPEKDENEVMISRQECSTNVLHQVDLILRKCISSYISKGKASWTHSQLQLICKRLPSLKEHIIKCFKEDLFATFTSSHHLPVENSAKDCSSELYIFVEQIFQRRASEELSDLNIT